MKNTKRILIALLQTALTCGFFGGMIWVGFYKTEVFSGILAVLILFAIFMFFYSTYEGGGR